jgi:hypothetical protein
MESTGLAQEIKDRLTEQTALYNLVEFQHNVNKAILRLRRRLAQANRIKTKGREQPLVIFSK